MAADSQFAFRDGTLWCENVSLHETAIRYGTPSYIYSAATVRKQFRFYSEALAGIRHRVCFAVKSNSNLAVLSLLAREGAGFDIVSGGELYRVLAAGGDPSSVVFSGVGKAEAEIRFAIQSGIHSFNCESEAEVAVISRVAQELGQTASVAFRVNPDVDASTHPYISTGLREHKFGVDIGEAKAIYARAGQLPGIILEGVSCHIGSQLLNVDPLLEAADKVLELVRDLRALGFPISFVDLGGGLGVPYRQGERAIPIAAFLAQLRQKLVNSGLTLYLEPGRSIVAEAGVLLSRVLLIKRNGEKTFVVLDAGMNDLIRPALYQAHHEIVPVQTSAFNDARMVADIVGPVCESGDFFALGRDVPSLQAGDLVTIRTAGAYGFVLSSNYNSRPRCCELLVDGARVHVARKRETYEDLIRGEIQNFDDTGDAPIVGGDEEQEVAGDQCSRTPQVVR